MSSLRSGASTASLAQRVADRIGLQRACFRLEQRGREAGSDSDDGVAEPTVLELRVDNAVIRACLKVQWVGRAGCWNPNGAHPDKECG